MVEDESDVNTFRLIGNIGLLRPAATPGGRELLNFTVATHYSVWDPSVGKRKEETEWHDVVAFAELAGRMKQQLAKGTRVEVVGYLRTRSWEDRENAVKHWRRELVAQEFRVIKRGIGADMALEETAGRPDGDVERASVDAPRVRLF